MGAFGTFSRAIRAGALVTRVDPIIGCRTGRFRSQPAFGSGELICRQHLQHSCRYGEQSRDAHAASTETDRRILAAGSLKAGITGSAHINHSGVTRAVYHDFGFRDARRCQRDQDQEAGRAYLVAGSLLGRCVRRRGRARCGW